MQSTSSGGSSKPLNWIEHFLIWLSGASEDALRRCPKWERRKYEAFGATVLVPTIFGMIASAYAVSTLAPHWWVIVPFALVWGYIIMSIDRVLLATYRAFTSPAKKFTQFVLRFTVAVLMGFAIAHPLTLLLFNDTITAMVERERDDELRRLRDAWTQDKQHYEDQISAVNQNLAALRTQQQDTLSAKFVEEAAAMQEMEEDGAAAGERPERVALEEQVEQVTAAQRARLTELDGELQERRDELDETQKEIAFWQEEYEEEVSGSRSGVAGVGPRARSIEADRLTPLRETLSRLNEGVAALTGERNTLAQEVAAIEGGIRTRFAQDTAAERAEIRREQLQVDALQRELQKQKLALFTSQQEDLLDRLEQDIDAETAERERLRAELTQVSASAQERIAGLQGQKRADLLTQTLVLHRLFDGKDSEDKEAASGGKFALTVYLMLAGLFMLIDTIPIIMKFFSNPGPYDHILYCQEQLYSPLSDDAVKGQEMKEEIEAQLATFKGLTQKWREAYRSPLLTDGHRDDYDLYDADYAAQSLEVPKPDPAVPELGPVGEAPVRRNRPVRRTVAHDEAGGSGWNLEVVRPGDTPVQRPLRPSPLGKPAGNGHGGGMTETPKESAPATQPPAGRDDREDDLALASFQPSQPKPEVTSEDLAPEEGEEPGVAAKPVPVQPVAAGNADEGGFGSFLRSGINANLEEREAPKNGDGAPKSLKPKLSLRSNRMRKPIL